tara:strand:+ start:13243 stop:13686 length:444 start_codon:yes stop_codon:yes gene_type:complete
VRKAGRNARKAAVALGRTALPENTLGCSARTGQRVAGEGNGWRSVRTFALKRALLFARRWGALEGWAAQTSLGELGRADGAAMGRRATQGTAVKCVVQFEMLSVSRRKGERDKKGQTARDRFKLFAADGSGLESAWGGCRLSTPGLC